MSDAPSRKFLSVVAITGPRVDGHRIVYLNAADVSSFYLATGKELKSALLARGFTDADVAEHLSSSTGETRVEMRNGTLYLVNHDPEVIAAALFDPESLAVVE